jgi:hypothetical protein
MIKSIQIENQSAVPVSLKLSHDVFAFSIDTSGADSVSYNSIYLSSILERVEFDGGLVGSESCLESVIEELNPTAPSSVTGLLDISGIETASVFSLFLERGDYFGNCLKVYRDSDGETLDIGFSDGGSIDSSSIVDFSQGGDVLVHTWYDQGVNGGHAEVTDPTLMPYIAKSGVYLGHVENQVLNTGTGLLTKRKLSNSTAFTMLSVVKVSGNAVILGTENSGQYHLVAQTASGLDPHTSEFSSMSYYVNKTEITSATRDDIYNEVFGDFHLVKTAGNALNKRKVQIGYGNLPSFNNSMFKAVVLLNSTPASVSDAEDELIDKYNLL